jgi:hypothetical protein
LSPQVLATFGWCLGKSAEAVPLLRAAQRRHPSDFWLSYYLGNKLHWAKQEEDPQGHRTRPQARSRPQQPRGRPVRQKGMGRGHRRVPHGYQTRPQARQRLQQPRQRPARQQ